MLAKSLKCLIFKLVPSNWLMQIEVWVAQWPDYQRLESSHSTRVSDSETKFWKSSFVWKNCLNKNTWIYLFLYFFLFILTELICNSSLDEYCWITNVASVPPADETACIKTYYIVMQQKFFKYSFCKATNLRWVKEKMVWK